MWQFDYRRVFGQPSDNLENCEMKSLVFVDFHTYGTYDYFFWIVQVLISWLKKAMKFRVIHTPTDNLLGYIYDRGMDTGSTYINGFWFE